ncbi:MerR family transcriptional regulator [Umezawaea beigongshangensis]|uniref:MerR family transcriptional regulator n=1 Tax=Umezawaea beigongshangensis TaxID=2780383 RepID=UPI0018F19465|nr:MerR family transcriptional regulator [Umezawaea beigongshangensis]
MLIGELSRRTQVNPHQLRYYEAQGLLTPDRAGNGYRDYDENAVLAVTQIRRLLDAGLSTQEIGYLQPCVTGEAPELKPCPETLDLLRERITGLDQQIDTLVRSRQTLREYLAATELRLSS